jgi:hypothetical protein
MRGFVRLVRVAEFVVDLLEVVENELQPSGYLRHARHGFQ